MLKMDPESSGYENIALRGLFLGMSREETWERMEDIAEFTALGVFLRLPIRTYSAGMRIRLAFAVATSIKPDILLFDDDIGAGKEGVLNKARVRLEQFTAKARIILLASHSLDLKTSMRSTAVLMKHGPVIHVGESAAVLEIYAGRSGGR